MKVLITPTEHFFFLDKVLCRKWEGVMENGATIDVYVHRVGTADPDAQRLLELAAVEMEPPRVLRPY